MLDLQRGVRDAVSLREQARQRAPRFMAVAVVGHDDVRRERREARGHLPHVEVVDLDDRGLRREQVADRVRIDADGCRFENVRADARSSPYAARSINAATSSDARGSARSNPVARITPAAIAVPTNA